MTLEDICTNHPYSLALQLCPAFLLCPEDGKEGDEMSRVAPELPVRPELIRSGGKNPRVMLSCDLNLRFVLMAAPEGGMGLWGGTLSILTCVMH